MAMAAVDHGRMQEQCRWDGAGRSFGRMPWPEVAWPMARAVRGPEAVTRADPGSQGYGYGTVCWEEGAAGTEDAPGTPRTRGSSIPVRAR